MIIEVNTRHITDYLSRAFHPDTIDYEGFGDEYFALNMTVRNDAEYAIRKWLGTLEDVNPSLKSLYKEDLRYLITSKIEPEINAHLPGITNIHSPKLYIDWSEEEKAVKKKALFEFFNVLWDVWFNELFEPADISLYRVRYDENFEFFPHLPELWNEPIYNKADVKAELPRIE